MNSPSGTRERNNSAECKPHGAAFLKQAAAGFVICGSRNESDVWIEDCSIASVILQLTAQSLGLGSCWIQIRNRLHTGGGTAEAYVQACLELPEELAVLSIISAGYSADGAAAESGAPDLSRVFEETYSPGR